MSLFDYRQALILVAQNPSYDAILMAAMLRADSANGARLAEAFPDLTLELLDRRNAPGGLLPGETAPEDFSFNPTEEAT